MARLAALLVCAVVLVAPASARTSRYGGTLVIGVSQEPGSLDPTVATTSTAIEILQSMCLPLYDFALNHGTYQYESVLAASLPELSNHGLSYTVALRQGIVFNDGTPLNADAVVATANRFMTFPGSRRSSDLANVASVTSDGPYTVVYHMRQRDSTLIASASYVVSPTALATEGANFAASPICVGPFMFDHRSTGNNVTLAKSPYYYKRTAVHLDKLVFQEFPDAAAEAAALQAGDLQVVDNVSPTQLAAVQSDSSLQLLKSPQLGWRGIEFNIGNRTGVGNPYSTLPTPLAQSAKLRQAFEEAIDRKTLNKVVFGGLYQPSCTMVPPANRAWFPLIQVPCTPYDPTDARKLVAASGFPHPTVHLLTPDASDMVALAQFVEAEESAAGIDVVIDIVDNATSSAMKQAGTFDATLGGRTPGSPDPGQVISHYVATNGDANFSGYSNPRLDYVLANGIKATQAGARAVNYRVADQIIHDDRPLIVLYNPSTFVAFSTSLKGIALNDAGEVQLANAQFTATWR
jgi:peptide/nickel transport system substrate-binding protein